uniref:Uncharacterized protein n=1 Tax=Trichogramma kaykai TaxID=54128 RepID=A0ABD2WDZ0_9HYME
MKKILTCQGLVVRDRPFASEREIENYTLTHVMIPYCCAKYCECVRFTYKKESTKFKLEFKNSQHRSSELHKDSISKCEKI